MSAVRGRAWLFGDDVDTDALAPGRYMKAGIDALARHCLESLDPDFAARVAPGDIVVAGENFGLGSSREQAAAALLHLGVAAVVARSFARIFYRNALNLGLTALVCPGGHDIRPGHQLRLDAATGRIDNLATGSRHAAEPIPPHLLAMVADGGLLPHLRKKLQRDRP